MTKECMTAVAIEEILHAEVGGVDAPLDRALITVTFNVEPSELAAKLPPTAADGAVGDWGLPVQDTPRATIAVTANTDTYFIKQFSLSSSKTPCASPLGDGALRSKRGRL